jgi:hypothetical protein
MSERPLFAATPIEILTSKILSSRAKNLYGIIAYTAGYPFRTRPIWYRDESLAKLVGCSITTLKRLKKELADIGVVERRRKGRVCFLAPKQFTDAVMRGLDPTVNNGARSILQEGLEDAQIWASMSPENGRGDSLYMKHKKGNKSAGLPAEKGSIEGSMEKGGEMAEIRKKRLAKRAGISGGRRATTPKMMGPKKFCERLDALISANYIETGDPPQTGDNTPKKRVAAMKKAMLAFEALGVNRDEFLKILEWLIPGWEEGLKRGISDRPFSIFTLYYRSKQILSAYRAYCRDENPEEAEEPEEDVEETQKELGDLGKYY